MIQKIKSKLLYLLSVVLWRANALGPNDVFYKAKTRILARWGVVTGTDIQFITGKLCYSCNGSGVRMDEDSECDFCAGSGYYKLPFYSVLHRVNFGKSTFHQPVEKIYNLDRGEALFQNAKPENQITGYVRRKVVKVTLAREFRFLLCLLLETKLLYADFKRPFQNQWLSHGFARNPLKFTIHNTLHLLFHKGKPSGMLNYYRERFWYCVLIIFPKNEELFINNEFVNGEGDDLPF